MNSNTPRLDQRRQAVSAHEVESLLRDHADIAMRRPSAALRHRVMAGLHQSAAQASQASAWQLRIVAIAAVCGLAAAISVIALLPQRASTDKASIANAPSSTWSTLVRLTDSATADLQLKAENPLVREARLIAKEARQTFSLLTHVMPLPPKFEVRPIQDQPEVGFDRGNGA